MERRLLYAIALMIGIMILSNVIFPPVERPLEPGTPGDETTATRQAPAGGEEPDPSGAERAAEEMAAALAEPEEMEVPGQEEAPAPRAGETVIVTVIVNAVGEVVERSKETAGGLANGLAVATALMIVFRQRYPRWWFDFSRELVRFGGRVGAYLLLLTDRYPSTVEEQSVHLNIDYPDAKRDLNRWLPLVKWLLVIPHVFVLFFLNVAAFLAVISAWFAILTTGRYPRGVFDFIVGVGRWYLRVAAYALLLVIDRIHHSACASNYRNKLNDCFHLRIQSVDATPLISKL